MIGWLLAAWPPFEHGGPNIAAREYFHHVRGFRRPHVSEPYVGGETGIPQVMVIEPLLDEEGRFLGILGGNASLHDGDSFVNLRSQRIGEEGCRRSPSREGWTTISATPNRSSVRSWNCCSKPSFRGSYRWR